MKSIQTSTFSFQTNAYAAICLHLRLINIGIIPWPKVFWNYINFDKRSSVKLFPNFTRHPSYQVMLKSESCSRVFSRVSSRSLYVVGVYETFSWNPYLKVLKVSKKRIIILVFYFRTGPEIDALFQTSNIEVHASNTWKIEPEMASMHLQKYW